MILFAGFRSSFRTNYCFELVINLLCHKFAPTYTIQWQNNQFIANSDRRHLLSKYIWLSTATWKDSSFYLSSGIEVLPFHSRQTGEPVSVYCYVGSWYNSRGTKRSKPLQRATFPRLDDDLTTRSYLSFDVRCPNIAVAGSFCS